MSLKPKASRFLREVIFDKKAYIDVSDIKDSRKHFLKYFSGGIFSSLAYRACEHSHNSVVRGNLGNSFEAMTPYYGLRMIGFNKIPSAIGSFVITSIFELAQYAGFCPGTYDPKDFAAYALGISVALGLDILSSKSQRKKSLETKLPQTSSFEVGD